MLPTAVFLSSCNCDSPSPLAIAVFQMPAPYSRATRYVFLCIITFGCGGARARAWSIAVGRIKAILRRRSRAVERRTCEIIRITRYFLAETQSPHKRVTLPSTFLFLSFILSLSFSHGFATFPERVRPRLPLPPFSRTSHRSSRRRSPATSSSS